MKRGWNFQAAGCVFALAMLTVPTLASEPAEVAAQTDKQLRTEVPFANATKTSPGRVGDEIFLRRISLDLVGRVPTPEQITAFVLDPSPNKRDKAVQKLLADSHYGENWGRYWRDVIMYRKTEERAQIIAGPLEDYLVKSMNENKPWSQIATDFITALGSAEDNGAVGLIMAQQGQPEEVTAEVSRIFLGVQIQCAQCHNHPTDRWKREQFHELAAFFPRVASQLILNQDRRTMQVVANDEQRGPMFRRPMMMRRIGTPEHYMPDLKDPQARGTLMTPVFFATGQKVPLGTKDADRRGTLAKWITATDNPYFAKAFVNRMWSEVCGEGFYEPVDDMGPDRHATAPQTLDYLAGQFAENGYDVKWLLRTIMATEMYQLPSAPRRGPEEPAFQAAVAQRLRADQLFDNLLHVLEASEPASMAAGRPGAGPYARFGGPRAVFNTAFGYDPSQRRDEIAGSIPQALAMMNAPNFNAAMRGTGQTMLARLLAEIKDDKGLVQELYLKTLAREPSQSEVTTCLLFVKQVGNRTEAFEDILWGLVNSTEFLHRS
jgi:Protein of unknown function (DUF1549)/Protein of unknown function (DUF1553)